MAQNPTASESTRSAENTNEPRGALPFSGGWGTERAAHPAAGGEGGRNASCLPGAPLLSKPRCYRSCPGLQN